MLALATVASMAVQAPVPIVSVDGGAAQEVPSAGGGKRKVRHEYGDSEYEEETSSEDEERATGWDVWSRAASCRSKGRVECDW